MFVAYCAKWEVMRSKLIVKILHLNTLKQDIQPDMYFFYFKFNVYPTEKKNTS